MREDSSHNNCPACKGEIPTGVLHGLCPQCLLESIATPNREEEPAQELPDARGIERIPAGFPDLEIMELKAPDPGRK